MIVERRKYFNDTVNHYLVPDEELVALLEPLRQERQEREQAALDERWQTWDAADAGDKEAKKWTSFGKRPTSRTVEVTAQSLEVSDYRWVDGRAVSKCAHCGAEIVRTYGKNRHRFCSNTCADGNAAYLKADRREYDYYTPVVRDPIPCAVCATPFVPTRSDAKTCSVKCRVKRHRAKVAA